MAKITWVFQNEEGTNLNRYKATNVVTNEEVIFDLLRDGSITIVGTPLNATNMNSLITSINSCYDDLSSHVNNASNPHNVTKAQIGLGNCDNTSDLNKPISTATQNALNEKVPTTRKVNNKALSGDITLDSSDVGATPLTVVKDNTINGVDIMTNGDSVRAVNKSQNAFVSFKGSDFIDSNDKYRLLLDKSPYTTSAQNCDTFTTSGVYIVDSGVLNKPDIKLNGNLFVMALADGFVNQYFQTYYDENNQNRGGTAYVRSKVNGTWSGWKELINSSGGEVTGILGMGSDSYVLPRNNSDINDGANLVLRPNENSGLPSVCLGNYWGGFRVYLIYNGVYYAMTFGSNGLSVDKINGGKPLTTANVPVITDSNVTIDATTIGLTSFQTTQYATVRMTNGDCTFKSIKNSSTPFADITYSGDTIGSNSVTVTFTRRPNRTGTGTTTFTIKDIFGTTITKTVTIVSQ